MVFTSAVFLFMFFPVVLVGYYIIPTIKLKNLWLLISSLVFYAWGEPRFITIMLLEIVINYILALIINKLDNKNIMLRKITLIFTVVIDLGILGFYKYINFAISNINKFTSLFILEGKINYIDIMLPIGISFFTFQILSYVIDVYRKEVKVQKNIISLALYVALFPQLIAGPIVRYIDVEKEISYRKHSLPLMYEGITRFLIGFFKKMFIANTLGFITDGIFKDISTVGTLSGWMAILCYMMQIFYDFSAYSDMAIGLGKMFGFNFKENFNYPYISKSIQEFWRRWHISLSTWFKDYLYIPLGGNRKGKYRTYINLFIVFFATGIWHGASWCFIAWGLFHGLFMILEKTKIINIKNPFIGRVYTLLVVIVGWVFFRVEGMHNALDVLKKMFNFNVTDIDINNCMNYINGQVILAFILAVIISTPFIKNTYLKIRDKNSYLSNGVVIFKDILLFVVFIISISYMVASSYNPFIYFRF